MAVGAALIIVLVLIVVVWILVELKRFRHKIWAIFLILLILFTYLSFGAVVKGKNLDFTSANGIKTAGQLYFSWLGSVFGNLKTITTNAIHMNWKSTNTSLNTNSTSS